MISLGSFGATDLLHEQYARDAFTSFDTRMKAARAARAAGNRAGALQAVHGAGYALGEAAAHVRSLGAGAKKTTLGAQVDAGQAALRKLYDETLALSSAGGSSAVWGVLSLGTLALLSGIGVLLIRGSSEG